MNQQRQNLFETMCRSDGLLSSLSHFASQYDDVKVVAALANVKIPSCQDFRGELASLSRHAENAEASYVYALLSDVCSLRLEAKNGLSVEDYTSLSKMLERTEAPAVLGCVDHKELLLLFGAAPNLNWRNNIAHGLVEDAPAGQFCPVDAYVWHRFLRFVLTAHQSPV